MPDPLGWLVLVGGALVASVVGGVAGFGAGIIMLPLVAWAIGVRSALGAVPATAVGTALYVGATSEGLGRIVGAFLVLSVPLRRVLAARLFRMRLRHFPVLGAFVGLLSALVVTTGPVNTPFFLAYGLRRSAYIGTEAVCATAMHMARGAALAHYAL